MEVVAVVLVLFTRLQACFWMREATPSRLVLVELVTLTATAAVTCPVVLASLNLL
jgi:hypothetical protein